jgi:hypothetical protein
MTATDEVPLRHFVSYISLYIQNHMIYFYSGIRNVQIVTDKICLLMFKFKFITKRLQMVTGNL